MAESVARGLASRLRLKFDTRRKEMSWNIRRQGPGFSSEIEIRVWVRAGPGGKGSPGAWLLV